MLKTDALLDKFIASTLKIEGVVVMRAGILQISPNVKTAIKTAKLLLPLLEDNSTKNRVACLLHDLYKELRADVKRRGTWVDGQKNPALQSSLEAYRIIVW